MPQLHPPDTSEPQAGAAFSALSISGPAGSLQLMLQGELDLVTAPLAHETVRSAQDESRAVICDLAGVWFVDLSGLRVLLDGAAHATRTGGRFTLANCPAIVPRMLRILKLEDALELEAAPPSAQRRRCVQVRRHVS